MAGIEHHGIDRGQIRDELRAQAGLDDFREIEPGNDEPVLILDDGKAEPLVDAVDHGQAAVQRELDLMFAVVQENALGQRLQGAGRRHLAHRQGPPRENRRTGPGLPTVT